MSQTTQTDQRNDLPANPKERQAGSDDIQLKTTDSQPMIQKPKLTDKASGPAKSILRKSSGHDDMEKFIRAPGEVRKSKTKMPLITRSDSSVYPSYTNLTLPYRTVCRKRYQRTIQMHNDQFIKEIKLHEKLQPFALNGVRLHREFCDPILRKVGSKDIIKLTLEQERRLEFILKTDPKDL